MVVVYAITSFHSCSKPMSPGNVMFLQLLEPPICRILTDGGLGLSWMVMSKLIATLFLHFEAELTYPKAELKEVYRYGPWPLDDK